MHSSIWLLALVASQALAAPPSDEAPAPSTATVEEKAEVKKDDGEWFRDANATRNLYSPTGFMLRQGEGYVSQKELVFTNIGYGVTDHISVMIGSNVAGWAFNAPNVTGGVKFGGDLNEMVHLAAGVQGLYFPQFGTGVLNGTMVAHGTFTYGTPNLNATVSLGDAIQFNNTSGVIGHHAMVTVGGMWRLSEHVALETEHWLFPQLRSEFFAPTEPLLMFNSAGVRLMQGPWSLDLGVIRLPAQSWVWYPVPWIDITYSFGS